MKTEIDEVTCSCGHTWELTTVYDDDKDGTGQTDYKGNLCPECGRDIREDG